MLSIAQEKLIRSLHTKKGREETGLLLVEGEKNVKEAGNLVQFTFTPDDTRNFDKLVSTNAPQPVAAVARIPVWKEEDVETRRTIVLLDGVQDPGNIGAIMRLCLGFDASLILVEAADITAPKVVRSSVGALFKFPWMKMSREAAESYLAASRRAVLRMEISVCSTSENVLTASGDAVLIAGSEGHGITLGAKGLSVAIRHNCDLESLNVGHALAIALHERFLNQPK